MWGCETDRPEPDPSEAWLSLQSRLSEITRLPVWIGELASRHSIPREIEFAINVCLEEAVSNVIRHGYGEGQNGKVTVHFTQPKVNFFEFTVEDEARHFNPLDSPAPDTQAPPRVGGQGVHFLRNFTEQLEYSVTPTGNRLRMVFSGENSGI
jgi:anti-sigma regulatory factor (Ser/Thr protein kinase)